MKNMKLVILVICYVASVVSGIGIIFNSEVFGGFLVPGVLISVALAVTAMVISLVEVFSSKKIDTLEKVLWLLGIVFIFTIVELLYLIFRSRVVSK